MKEALRDPERNGSSAISTGERPAQSAAGENYVAVAGRRLAGTWREIRLYRNLWKFLAAYLVLLLLLIFVPFLVGLNSANKK